MSLGTIRGKAFKYGDNVDTDVIAPVRFLMVTDPKELRKAAFADLDPEFQQTVQPGDTVVGGKNFGCGSSREHAPIAIKEAGAGAVIAESFARIFFRNAINIGLPALECPEAAQGIAKGDEVEIDFSSGRIVNVTKGETYQAKPIPPFMGEIFAAGGLVGFLRQKLGITGGEQG